MYRSRWRSLSASKKFCAASCVRVCKSPQKLSCNSATKCWKCSVIGIIFAMGVGLLFWNGFSLRGQSQLTPSCFLHNRIYVTTLQHSWWSCVECQLGKVAGTCAAAAVSCAVTAETVVGYLACVGLACGGAVTSAGLCCACNGSGWCRWAVGSCSESAQCSSPPPPGPPVVIPPPCERCCEYDPKKGHCIRCVSGREVCP